MSPAPKPAPQLAGPGHALPAPLNSTDVVPLPRRARPRNEPSHPVQLYAKDDVMLDQVARFMAPALRDGVAGIIIATPAHMDGLRQRLGTLPCLYLDAEATLGSFLHGDRIDVELFDAIVGEAVRAAARRSRGRVRAFGEMVAVLCKQGRHGLALELEALWNRLANEVPLTLLCAYPMSVFNGPGGLGALADVCAHHDHVLSTAMTPSLAASPGSATAPTGEPASADPLVIDFVEHGPVGMHQVDGNGTILWVNRYELDLLGYTREEFVGRNIKEFHGDRRVVDDIFTDITAGQVVVAKRSALRCKDGTYLPVLISSNGVVDDGRLVRSRCIVRPIDDLVLLERARRDSEASLVRRERQQACVARIGHLALRPGSLDAFFDTVCREITQATGADSCSLLECLPDGDGMRFRAGYGYQPGFQATVPTDAGSHADYILRSGSPVLYADLPNEKRFRPAPHLIDNGVRSGMSVPVQTATGPWGTIGLHCRTPREFTRDDINFLEAVAHVFASAIERRQAHDDLERARDRLEALVRERTARLEQANRELDAFSSAVSHDLRGPVRAISGFSALLAQQHAGRLDPRGRELLDEVRRAATRMGDLIEDLLDLSRADRALPTRVAVDLSTMARDILASEAAHAPTRTVQCDVEPGLIVQGDPDLLRVALENLLSNSWKFTVRAPEARITVSKRREGEELVLCIQDNGAGFDMADAGRLFQPFQRLHRRSEYDGTGIGLATVRRIIERHGGRVWAQSRPGAGAAFYFTLPGLAPEAKAEAPVTGPASLSAPPKS